MYLTHKYNLSKISFINLLIAMIPMSLIIGNMAININIILINISGLIIFRSKIFLIKKNFLYLIYGFFLFVIISTFVNNIPNLGTNELFEKNLLKSLFFLRFLLLFLIINKLLEENNFNIKLFFNSSVFFSITLTLDIIIQLIFGVDLIGNPIYFNKPSGFFGEELIAGSYLQKFCLFTIFFISLKINNFYKKNIYIFLSFIFFSTVILLTGNRMPLIIFFSSFICFFLFQKSLKYFIYTAIFFVCLISFFIKYPLIERIDVQLKNFIKSSVNIIVEVPKIFYSNSSDEIKSWTPDGYIIHFNSGVQLWKKNKIIGNGIKSLPIYCKYENNTTCNTHPHNYFIEILMDTGIIGLSLIYSIFIFGLVKSIKHYLGKNKKKITYISIPIFLIIFFEFFPLRSTGSFFTTSVASIIFTFFPMFLSIEKIKFYNK